MRFKATSLLAPYPDLLSLKGRGEGGGVLKMTLRLRVFASENTPPTVSFERQGSVAKFGSFNLPHPHQSNSTRPFNTMSVKLTTPTISRLSITGARARPKCSNRRAQ